MRSSARAVLGLGLVAGCAAASPPAVPVGEVVAVAAQTRTDEVAVRRFEITVANAGSRPFTVESVQLQSDGFQLVPPSERTESVPTGVRYALPAAYGPARCDRPAVPAYAVVVVRRDAEPARPLTVALDPDDGLLQRLHDQDCTTAELAQQVAVSLTGLQASADTITGSLRVQRRSASGPIALTQVRSGVLYALDVAPATLPAGRAVLDVPVTITLAGCTGHIIGEVKQPYAFSAFVRLGERAAQAVNLPPSPQQQELLRRLVRTACTDRR